MNSELAVLKDMALDIGRRLDELDIKARVDAEWDESAHPRSEDGKFGSGGGSAKSEGSKEGGGPDIRGGGPDSPRSLGERGIYKLGIYNPKIGDYIDYYDKNGEKQYGKVNKYNGDKITVGRTTMKVMKK